MNQEEIEKINKQISLCRGFVFSILRNETLGNKQKANLVFGLTCEIVKLKDKLRNGEG